MRSHTPIALMIALSAATAQAASCPKADFSLTARPHTTELLVWTVQLENRSSSGSLLQITPLGFQWTLEEHQGGKWNEVVTGGIGPGQASLGSKSKPENNMHALALHQDLYITAFDLASELKIGDVLIPATEYRITFKQDIRVIKPELPTPRCTASGQVHFWFSEKLNSGDRKH